MAASDQTYRKQYALDIVFAVSSVLMLVSIVLMFMQDYYRPWKQEQRAFRDVEVGVAQSTAFELIPSKEEFDRALKKVADEEKVATDDEIGRAKSKMDCAAKKEESDAAYQAVKERYDSKLSFVNQAPNKEERAKFDAELKKIGEELVKVQAVRDDNDQKMKDLQGQYAVLEKGLTEARGELKKLNDRFLTQASRSINRRWGLDDFVRGLPIIDGFASPTKIHQFTINDIPIDYNLAVVRRFDRCMTCHQGIDRPTYTKDMLKSLRHPLPENMRASAAEFWKYVQSMKPKDKDFATRSDKSAAAWAVAECPFLRKRQGESAAALGLRLCGQSRHGPQETDAV